MRTLIIDNYDSFTYNLYHLVGTVTGVAPVVVRNDEPGWTVADLAGFANVIISPGPGRPDRTADFGICADVIRHATIPLLGVCLGHQGICHVHGGDIGQAPRVRHGETSPVLHDGVDILAGLPSPFAAVRYHSLVATQLPADLEPIATTPDGVLMAVRHRSRPQWGVQFHPESIRTEHGRRLIENFAGLAQRPPRAEQFVRIDSHVNYVMRNGSHDGRFVRNDSQERLMRIDSHEERFVRDHSHEKRLMRNPSHEEPVARNHSHDAPAHRVRHRRLDLDIAAEVVFDALYRDSDYAFWLDSADATRAGGRFSFLGDAAGPLTRVVTADVTTNQVTVRQATRPDTVVPGPFLDWLAADLAERRVAPTGLPFDFALGWVGYLGYELKAECGVSNTHRSSHPDAALIFADRAIVFDHQEQNVYLLTLTDDGWLDDTEARLRALAQPGSHSRPDSVTTPFDRTVRSYSELGALRARDGRDTYLDLIAACQREIIAGESYEICLTTQLTAHGKLDPWQSYRRLRRDNPEPFAALLRLGELSVLSASPERFLTVSADGVATSKPIKGTRPRGATEDEDARLRQDLATSAKDHAENLMIVDLVRNDLGSCAELGAVHVEKLFDVETFATVHQMVSTIRARLRADRTAVDCVRAAFPGGSMTGAPKRRTMEIIDRLEGGARGVYSGVLGYFSLNGAAELCMVIRTLVVEPDRVSYGVGGAIIALSEPDAEHAETVVKATPILRLLGQEFPTEGNR